MHLDIGQMIRERAYEIWRYRITSQEPGDELSDWEDARAELGIPTRLVRRKARAHYVQRVWAGRQGSAEGDWQRAEEEILGLCAEESIRLVA
jgi:hypothetical protein